MGAVVKRLRDASQCGSFWGGQPKGFISRACEGRSEGAGMRPPEVVRSRLERTSALQVSNGFEPSPTNLEEVRRKFSVHSIIFIGPGLWELSVF